MRYELGNLPFYYEVSALPLSPRCFSLVRTLPIGHLIYLLADVTSGGRLARGMRDRFGKKCIATFSFCFHLAFHMYDFINTCIK